jgi:hypothetical protein
VQPAGMVRLTMIKTVCVKIVRKVITNLVLDVFFAIIVTKVNIPMRLELRPVVSFVQPVSIQAYLRQGFPIARFVLVESTRKIRVNITAMNVRADF